MKHPPLVLMIPVTSVLVLGWTAPRAGDEIYACRDAYGNVVYQDDPCTEDPGAKLPAPSTGAVGKKPRKAAAEHGTTKAAKKVPPAGGARPPQDRRIVGEASGGWFPTNLDGVTPPAGSSFTSPAGTWRTFLAAIGRGDRPAAVACFAPSAVAGFGPHAKSFPLEKLRETLSTFTRIEIEGDVGPFWSIRALRPNQRPKWIFFEKTGEGEWKIAAI